MTIETITSLIWSALGYIWAASLGVILTLLVEGRREKIRLLFEARTKAYSSLVWKIQNFLLPDLLEKESHMRSYEYNSIFSEAILLSSRKLHILLKDYRKLTNEFYAEIQRIQKEANGNYEMSEETESNFRKKSEELIELMRKDLYIVS